MVSKMEWSLTGRVTGKRVFKGVKESPFLRLLSRVDAAASGILGRSANPPKQWFA